MVCLVVSLPKLLHYRGSARRPAGLVKRLEWITYDWRMRIAANVRTPVATNLAAVFIDDEGLRNINEQTGFYWPLPRQLFGRVLRELRMQGARGVALDVFFLDRHPDFTETRITSRDGRQISSDAFFAQQIRESGNVILGCPGSVSHGVWRWAPPVPEFRDAARACGYATTDRDADGVLRRAVPYQVDPERGRLWHLGLELAARHLNLDLEHAVVGPRNLRIPGPQGIERTVPLDEDGLFLVDWSLKWNDPRITKAAFDELLEFDDLRQQGGVALESALQDKLVVVGSLGTGSNVSDVGGTPVERETFLVSQHWNVANALLTERFIRPASLATEVVLVILLGAVAAFLTLRLRAWVATGAVVALSALYVGLAVVVFVNWRWWLPVASPVGGALFMTHVAMVTSLAAFESRERRHLKALFSRMVAPEVVEELLGRRELSLGGALRPVTVFFADIRGFTRLTDENLRRAQEYLQERRVEGAAAAAYLELNAAETLASVNVYLATVADLVKQHGGTLDKYIGDCVMAFWGAPLAREEHARDCVRAAVEAQRAIQRLNIARAETLRRVETENQTRLATGEPPLPLPGLLTLGTGINTGVATVGLMGSGTHVNYTVFGREVNLASRLEGVSGHGRIIISDSTFRELLRWDPPLARACKPLEPVSVKGIAKPIQIYEVPWQNTMLDDLSRK